MSAPLDSVTSLKTKLGALVAVSVLATGLLTLLGATAGVPALLVLPVSIALALGITQLLAAGMVSPLRQMTSVTQAMARGDYTGRVHTTSTDEVGRLALAFNQMADDLSTVDRERRDLLATVSHELRTPLTAMTATLENLADGVVPADQQSLRAALVQAERLRDLVADLLELSRLEAGVTKLRREPFDLHELATECVEHVRLAGRTSPFVVTVPAPMVVVADRARIAQLLINVLDNASRHSPPGSPVTISGTSGPDGWSLEVEDRGPGVSEAERERVFEHWGTSGTSGGTGLGLAVSQWAARLHGGALRFVDPVDGVGARLRLTVPSAVETPKEPAPTPVTTDPVVRPPQAVGRPVVSGLDALFGRFWPDAGGAGRPTVVAAALAGAFGAMVMSFTAPGISWTLLLLVSGAVAYAFSRRRGEPWTIACTVLAALLVLPMTLLDAWWIGMLGMLAAAAVFLVGLTGARTPLGVVLTGVSWPLASLRGLPWFGRSLRISGPTGVSAVVRTLAWSFLALAVFGWIFASADAVFASWIDGLVPNLTFTSLVGRVFVGLGIFALTLAAAYLGVNPSDVEVAADRRPPVLRNRFEWLAPVLVVDAVFVAFLLAQASAFFGGHGYVERTTGLTYADYVHQGFGQLTLATALTLVVVWIASRRAGDDAGGRRWLKASLGLLCLLTLVVVASALHRMHVYQQAYGFTALRLAVDVFEGWLGFVVLAVMVGGLLGLGRWVPRAAVLGGAAAVLGLALLNPDAWVAGRNIDRYEATGKVDLFYLQDLSADAAPVIAERLPERLVGCVLLRHRYNTLSAEVLDDPRAWNWGRARGDEALRAIEMPDGGPWECADVWSAAAR